MTQQPRRFVASPPDPSRFHQAPAAESRSAGQVVLAVLALLVSGVGYLVLNDLLANAAFVSGPLLLVWVSATGLALSRPRNLETVSPAASG